MKKTHIFRIILSALFSVLLIQTATIMNTVFTYIIGTMILNSSLTYDTARIVQIFVWIWNYTILVVLIICVWRWFGLKDSLKIGFIKYFKPSYWENLEIEE